MSYDLAVWEGARPKSNDEALSTFEKLYDQHFEVEKSPPSAAIAQYVKAITARYPCMTELPEERVDESPWSDGPIIENASGPIFYFGLSFSRVKEVAPFCAETAHAQGLTCFDPQSGDFY
jgi:hypothetical protein